MPEIIFHYNIPVTWFRQRTKMKQAIMDLFKREKVSLHSLNVVFVSDRELLSMNQQYLKHDTYTDIITFDLSEATAKDGELYISIDRVIANADSLSLSRSIELRRVIFHGCLHLCGFKDKLKKDIEVIRKKEDEYLLRYLTK